MILIVGNNITSLFLSAYLEKKNIEYRRIYTQDLVNHTFYFNDINQGMQKRALDQLDLHMKEAGERAFYVRTTDKEYRIEEDFETFIQKMEENVIQNAGIKPFGTMILDIGKEWKESVDHKFAVKMTLDSVMAKNFMKGYTDYLSHMIEDQEMKNIFQSFMPREDISLNTAAGYLYNQVFDSCPHRNQIEDLSQQLRNMCKVENQVKLSSFDELEVDRENKTVSVLGETINYDTYVKLFGDKDSDIKLTTFYVDCETAKDSYIFYHLDNMKEAGISQMILWNGNKGSQLDVYYEASVLEQDVEKYVVENMTDVNVKKRISYDALKKQYGNGNFAGWAFNVKENAKNPIVCKNQEYMDLSGWGNAHFTCALIAVNNLEKVIGGRNE